MLLDSRAMRTTVGSTNPWGTSIDDGWKDLVVSSAPPPPPPREDAPVKNRALPDDFNTWQEHGSAKAAQAQQEAAEEPSFSKGDRRMWLVAGTLMGAAVLVLGLLGVITFSPPAASAVASVVAPAPAPLAAPTPAPARAAEPPRTKAATAAAPKSSNPRILKASSHSSKARHHKRNIAAR
jgi:hypothetical protein